LLLFSGRDFFILLNLTHFYHFPFTDYFCTVKVIDESYTKPGISVNFFAPAVERLPRVASPGDIIVLSDVVVFIYWFHLIQFSSCSCVLDAN